MSAVSQKRIQRRRAQIALIEEMGGDAAPLKTAAQEAVRRGMYSQKTTLGDIESALNRIWLKRNREVSKPQVPQVPPLPAGLRPATHRFGASRPVA